MQNRFLLLDQLFIDQRFFSETQLIMLPVYNVLYSADSFIISGHFPVSMIALFFII